MAGRATSSFQRVSFEAEHPERQRFEARLERAFDEIPLEDGVDHPAEVVIDEAMRSMDEWRVLAWLEALAVDTERPELAASVLGCLGRRRPGSPAWRIRVVRASLAADDVEMRDASVQAAESWGGLEMRDVLQAHAEPVSWLRDYVRDVIDDLGK